MLGGTAVAGASGLGYSIFLEPDWIDIEQHTITLPTLSTKLDGFTIAHLSDLHLHPYTQIDLIQKAVRLTNDLKPDLVALTGDYVLESANSAFDLGAELAKLQATYGVVASLGNHDYWTQVDTVVAGLTDNGIDVLVNDGKQIEDGLFIAGLDDGWSGRPDLDEALKAHNGRSPIITLMHEPDFADQFAQDERVHLQLSGHSHGGQIRIPFLGAPILPRFGQRYSMGLYQVGNMQVYTNRGIGVIGPTPMRLACRPEITLFTLKSAV